MSFFALLAAISGNSSKYAAVNICHCCSNLLERDCKLERVHVLTMYYA